MYLIRHNLILARRALADALTGAQVLGLLPGMLLLCYWLDAELPVLIGLISVPAMAVLCAGYGRIWPSGAVTPDAYDRRAECKSFEQAAAQALERLRLRGGTVLCLMMELKPLGSGSGPGPGAGQVKSALRKAVRCTDYLSDLGDGRFGAILAQARWISSQETQELAFRLRSEVERQYPGQTVSIGVAGACDAQMTSGAQLVRKCQDALVRARSAPEPQVEMIHQARRAQSGRPSDAGKDIQHALENGEFLGWFQPQICAQSGAVTGFETLARWQHPTRGLLMPLQFLPDVQAYGLMPQLHERMLAQALDAVQTWARCPGPTPVVGLNVSPEDLSDPLLPDRIMWELDRRDLPTSCLTIEILETVVSTTPTHVTTRNIRRLSDLGCQIDLDDFGTGHASIASLRNFALHRIKIDQSFIRHIDTNPAQEKLVAAILAMAGQLGLETLAEGVETRGEAERLRQLGCQYLQGYGIARPMPLNDALAWLKDMGSDHDWIGPSIRNAAS